MFLISGRNALYTFRRQEHLLSTPTLIRPAYAESFRCIGSSCEDTCCRGWSVPIDQASYQKYQSLPVGPLRSLLDASIQLAPEGATSSDGFGPEVFAKIAMTKSNQCPMLSADHLCRVQTEGGAELLSHSCATYPRIVRSVAGAQEMALSLSCPEAARLALLGPMRLLKLREPDGANSGGKGPGIQPWFLAIRSVALNLVRNRAYPLWQRMFLLGILCRRLDAIASGEPTRTIPELLIEFEATVARGTLRQAMGSIIADAEAQMDLVLRLAGLMLYRSNVTPRFVECINAFTAGIGNGPKATLESLAAQSSVVHDRYFTPFFDRHPQILENYLINTILRCQFPFGRDGMKEGASPSVAREFSILTAQFALMKGLLIGVAGFHREGFSKEDVVHTVQAASKHFDHHPDFFNEAHILLVESRMDGARGMAILLKNAGPVATDTAPSIFVPGPMPVTAAL
jgi:lysine-N-methylase